MSNNSTDILNSVCTTILWKLQVGISVSIPIFIIVLGFIIRNISRYIESKKLYDDNDDDDGESGSFKFCLNHNQRSLLTKIQLVAVKTYGGKNKIGKILISVRLIIIVITGSIFIYVTYRESVQNQEKYTQVYFCIPWGSDTLLLVDALLQIIFVVNFVLSLFAGEDIFHTLLSESSIIDYLTLIPDFLMLIMGYHNYGLRFFNFLRLRSSTQIMLQLNIIKNARKIIFSRIFFTFLGLWLTGAGIYMIVHGIGANFTPQYPEKPIHYFDCLYFLLITMSTVGYGDISPSTIPGKLFIIFFVVFAIGMFTTFIPELMAVMAVGRKYNDSYKRRHGQRHIIVCGHVNYQSIVYFIKDFYHKERVKINKNIQLVFLSDILPNEQLEALLSRNWTKVKYLRGKVSNPKDLKRAKIGHAECVIILSNSSECDHEVADWSTVLSVSAIKQCEPHIQVIAQILDHKNKKLLQCIPGWNFNREHFSDKVVCMNELKMGLLGQSALVPGFSTFFINCLTYAKVSKKTKDRLCDWKLDYFKGCNNTLVNVNFSVAFDKLSFTEAVKICYRHLSVILMAVVLNPTRRRAMSVLVNPGDSFIIMTGEMRGLVLSPSHEHAKRVENFCQSCHESTNIIKMFDKSPECECDNKDKFTISGAETTQVFTPIKLKKTNSELDRNKYVRKKSSVFHNLDLSFDGPSQNTYTDILQILQVMSTSQPQEEPSPMPQLDYTKMYHYDKEKSFDEMILTPRQALEMNFHNHIVVCVIGNSQKPLNYASFILPLRSSLISRDELREVVVIGDIQLLEKEWMYIKNQPLVHMVKGSPLNDMTLHIVNLRESHSCVILGHTDTESDDENQMDRESILCSLNIKKYLREHFVFGGRNQCSLITELRYENNSHYIYPEEGDGLNFGYMTGAIFNVSRLNTLMCTNYFNPTALLLLETLLSGDNKERAAKIFSRGIGLMPSKDDDENSASKFQQEEKSSRCRMCLLSINSPSLRLSFKPIVFKDLFLGLLETKKIVCLGIYRLIGQFGTSRFVYTFPSPNAILDNSDQVYFLQSN